VADMLASLLLGTDAHIRAVQELRSHSDVSTTKDYTRH
jgi:site-specific recombinase XerC